MRDKLAAYREPSVCGITECAPEAVVPAIELPRLASLGGLQNVAHDLFRVTDVPTSAVDQNADALLRVGDGAYLRTLSVLALLGLPRTNPRSVRVVVKRRVCPKRPPFFELVQTPVGEHTTHYEGLVAQLVAGAIVASQGRTETRRLREDVTDARAEGLLTTGAWRRVMGALRA